jgi:parallel beta-helix repeat protein
LDGNVLSPDGDLPELIKNRKKSEPIALVVERGFGDNVSEITVQFRPKQTQQKNKDYGVGLRFASIIGWRTFLFEDCQAVIAYGNEINRSGLTGIHLDHCSEALVACNTMCYNHEEGNIFLVDTDKAIIAFNDSHSASYYNVFLDYSVGLAIHHNQIRGGEEGIHLKGSNSSVRSNLITDSNVGIVFSGGMQNIVESNIFAHNKTLVRGQGGYWGVATFKANLMDKQVDYSNLGNIRLDMKNSNILCQFDTSMSLDGPSRLLVRSRDVNNVSDLQSHAYGPTVSLKPQYLAICNRIADIALEFGILDSDVSVNTEFNEILRSKTTRIIKEIKEMGLPTVNEKNLGLIPDQLVGARELNRNPMKIPRQAKAFGSHHYLLYLLEVTTWKNAMKFCKSVGGHLVTITGAEEDKWIRETFAPSLGFWLGGTDEAEEGKWRWVTGEKWRYSSWDEGEPNNQGGVEHALHMRKDGWNDETMEKKLYFLIEWDH